MDQGLEQFTHLYVLSIGQLNRIPPNPDTLFSNLKRETCTTISEVANRMRYKGGNFQWLEQHHRGRGYLRLKIIHVEAGTIRED